MLSLIQLSAKVCSKKHETMFTLCSTKCATQGCVKYVKEAECVQELMKAQADLVEFSTPPPLQILLQSSRRRIIVET